MDCIIFCSLFSYHSLLKLNYGGRMNKSQTAREQAIEVGRVVREAERRRDIKLFLTEYPRWELGAPHWSVILHEMFLHAAKWEWKEAERFICWGHWGSLPRPELEADQSAMKLMGYQTSHKKIQDLYHSVYLLRRSPGPPTSWATAEKGSNPWHSLYSKELVSLMGVSCCSQRRYMGACRQTLV